MFSSTFDWVQPILVCLSKSLIIKMYSLFVHDEDAIYTFWFLFIIYLHKTLAWFHHYLQYFHLGCSYHWDKHQLRLLYNFHIDLYGDLIKSVKTYHHFFGKHLIFPSKVKLYISNCLPMIHCALFWNFCKDSSSHQGSMLPFWSNCRP